MQVMALKSFRKIIEVENKSKSTPAAEWDTDDWSEFEREIKIKQNLLNELEFVGLLCRIITLEPNEVVKFNCIKVAISMLLGGNYDIQESF
jgi:hypothetical protein